MGSLGHLCSRESLNEFDRLLELDLAMDSTLDPHAKVFLPKILPPRSMPRTTRFCPMRVKYSDIDYEYKPPNLSQSFNPGVTANPANGNQCKICSRLGRRCHMHLNQVIKLTSVFN